MRYKRLLTEAGVAVLGGVGGVQSTSPLTLPLSGLAKTGGIGKKAVNGVIYIITNILVRSGGGSQRRGGIGGNLSCNIQ